MKKQGLNFGMTLKSIALLILILTLSQGVIAQRNNLKITAHTQGKVSLGVERKISKRTTAVLSFISSNKDYTNWQFFSRGTEYDNKGKRLAGEYRFYLAKGNKPFNGLYVAPNASIGKHEVSYKRTTSSGLGLGLLSAGIDVAADGNLDNSLTLKVPQTIKGNSKVNASSLGLKVGYQKRYKTMSFDLGVNFLRNKVGGNKNGMQLNNGTFKTFKPDLRGDDIEYFFGLGFAF